MLQLYMCLMLLCKLCVCQLPIEFQLESIPDLNMIEINLKSLFGQHANFSAHSRERPDRLPVVYLPVSVSINVDLSRSRPGSWSVVRAELGSATAKIEEWSLCFAVSGRSADCRPLLGDARSLPELHDLESGRVHVIMAWFERVRSGEVARFATVSLPFEAREPENKREWFCHIVGGGGLTPAEKHAILSGSFARSHRSRLGPRTAIEAHALEIQLTSPWNDASVNGDGTYFYTTEYKLRHDIEQMEVIAESYSLNLSA